MQGLILLGTFIVMAAISLVIAGTIGVVIDQLPHIHDMLSLLAFFGTLVAMLPIAWLIAVKITEPKHAPAVEA